MCTIKNNDPTLIHLNLNLNLHVHKLQMFKIKIIFSIQSADVS